METKTYIPTSRVKKNLFKPLLSIIISLCQSSQWSDTRVCALTSILSSDPIANKKIILLGSASSRSGRFKIQKVAVSVFASLHTSAMFTEARRPSGELVEEVAIASLFSTSQELKGKTNGSDATDLYDKHDEPEIRKDETVFRVILYGGKKSFLLLLLLINTATRYVDA
jgi:hypothetical protein